MGLDSSNIHTFAAGRASTQPRAGRLPRDGPERELLIVVDCFSIPFCSKIMFHIVDFVVEEENEAKDETEVVPASWVGNGRSYWPPYNSRERCYQAISRAAPPEESWTSYKIRRIKATKSMIYLIN